MADPVVLTFAEIEFLLRVRPDQADVVRADLRMGTLVTDEAVAAGLASLVARRLCEVSGGEVRPSDPLYTIAAALALTTSRIELAVFSSGAPLSVRIYDGPGFRVSVTPGPFGQYTFAPMNAAEPLDIPLRALTGRYASGSGQLAFAMHASLEGSELDIAFARNADGGWLMSDSRHNPDAGAPATREEIDARLSELFGAVKVAAV